jgi:hypothetical protein
MRSIERVVSGLPLSAIKQGLAVKRILYHRIEVLFCFFDSDCVQRAYTGLLKRNKLNLTAAWTGALFAVNDLYFFCIRLNGMTCMPDLFTGLSSAFFADAECP